MIRLRNILLETPADDAKRMGLVSKPGFGLYGPPGDDEPATHRSMLGRLVQIKQDTTSAKTQPNTQQKQNEPQSTQPAPQQNVTKQKSVVRNSSPIGRTRVYEVAGLSDMVSGVSNTFGSDGRITNLGETLNAVTRQFW